MELLLIFSRTSNERNEIIVVSYDAHGSVLNTIVTEYNLRQQDLMLHYKLQDKAEYKGA